MEIIIDIPCEGNRVWLKVKIDDKTYLEWEFKTIHQCIIAAAELIHNRWSEVLSSSWLINKMYDLVESASVEECNTALLSYEELNLCFTVNYHVN